MNFGVACDGILKTVILPTVLKIFWGGEAQKNANFSGKLRSQKSVDRNSSFGANIIAHKFQLGPNLQSWDPASRKILAPPLILSSATKNNLFHVLLCALIFYFYH
jgi:hypothetical protein